MRGLYYDDFEVGSVIVHAVRRTVTELDNVLITTLSMNPQPLHLDEEFSKTTEHGTRLVNSIFTLALVTGLSVSDTTLGTTLGNLGFEEVRFPAPVIPGDTIRSETRVLEKRLSKSRADAGIVWLLHSGFNQREETICVCKRAALVLREPPQRVADLGRGHH